MENGYIVYQILYYASEYIKHIVDTLGEVVWENQWDEEKIKWEILHMNGERNMIKSKSLIVCPFSTK